MAARAHGPSASAAASAGLIALEIAALAIGWLWLVAGAHRDEMIVGALVVLVVAVFLRFLHKSESLKLHFTLKDLAQGWRIPWYLLSGTWEIILVLLKDLLSIHPAGSFYRVCGFKSGKRDAIVIARGVLATVYTTVAPNFIVIGIDPEMSRMLFHQIERSDIPKMTRSLGAQP